MSEEVIQLYNENEGPSARKSKRKLLIIWIASAIFYLAVVLTLALVDLHRINNYYDRTYHALFTVIASVLTVFFCAGSWFFFAVPFRMIRDTVRLHDGFIHGDKETAEVKFIEKNDALISKDGMEFYSIKVETKPLRRGDITERQVLIGRGREFPDLSSGTRILATTHSAILISYKVLDTQE